MINIVLPILTHIVMLVIIAATRAQLVLPLHVLHVILPVITDSINPVTPLVLV
jgi:hypothetical protein